VPTWVHDIGKNLTDGTTILKIFRNNFNPIEPAGYSSNVVSISGGTVTTFDMTSFFDHGGHEVVCATSKITGVGTSVSLTMTQKWFNSDNNLVFTNTFSVTTPSSGGPFTVFTFSFIGWKNDAAGGKELFENSTGSSTSTRVVHETTGDISDGPTEQTFSVTNATTLAEAQSNPDGAFLWVNDTTDELSYTDSFGYRHNIPSSSSSSPAPAALDGFVWVDDSGSKDGMLAYTSSGDVFFY